MALGGSARARCSGEFRAAGPPRPDGDHVLLWRDASLGARRPDALEGTLRAARKSSRPPDPDRHLRADDRARRLSAKAPLLPSLPGLGGDRDRISHRAGSRVAHRRVGRGVATELELHTLSPQDALRLLAAHGPRRRARAPTIVEWAQGYPLALAPGGRHGVPRRRTGHPSRVPSRPRCFACSSAGWRSPSSAGVRLSALAVAAIAPRHHHRDASRGPTGQRPRSRVRASLVADVQRASGRRARAARARAQGATRPTSGVAIRIARRELRRRIVDYLYERGAGTAIRC